MNAIVASPQPSISALKAPAPAPDATDAPAEQIKATEAIVTATEQSVVVQYDVDTATEKSIVVQYDVDFDVPEVIHTFKTWTQGGSSDHCEVHSCNALLQTRTYGVILVPISRSLSPRLLNSETEAWMLAAAKHDALRQVYGLLRGQVDKVVDDPSNWGCGVTDRSVQVRLRAKTTRRILFEGVLEEETYQDNDPDDWDIWQYTEA